MYSIILAAGKGTRLEPLSFYIPKLLMPVRGRPVLDYLLANFSSLNVDTHYILASSHMSTIDTYISKTGLKNVKTIRVLGWETGGDLAAALEEIGKDDDVVVANGDLITDINLKELYDFHKNRKADVSMSLFKIGNKEDAKKLGSAELNSRGRVMKFVEKPKNPDISRLYAGVGFYILDKKFVKARKKYLPHGRFKLELELFPRLAKEGKLYGFAHKVKYYWDIGTLDNYLRAENYLADKHGLLAPSK